MTAHFEERRAERAIVRARLFFVLSLAGALLAACGPPGPGATATGNSETSTTLAALPNGRAPDEARPQSPTERLAGLTSPELRAALGEPDLLSQEGPAQLWQYARKGCVLHVFLYQDNGAYRVKRSEIRIDDPSADNPPTCAAWKGKDAPAS